VTGDGDERWECKKDNDHRILVVVDSVIIFESLKRGNYGYNYYYYYYLRE